MYKICDRFYLTIHNNLEDTKKKINKSPNYITSSDFHDSYIPLDKDYGPLNICDIIKFNKFIDDKIKHPKLANRNIIYYIYNDDNHIYLLNSVLLCGSYLIFNKNYNWDKVLFKLHNIFNDHPCYYIDCISKWGGYKTSITDCFRTLDFIYKNNIIDIAKFDISEYEYFTDFENRDMNIIANKFLAMTCPSLNKDINNIICELKKRDINLIIRLNNPKSYDKKIFNDNNIIVEDLFFEDYTTPDIKIIKKFINLINNTNYDDLVAVHCKAGLGRTGLLICIWLIIKLNFTPKNAITYIRLIRPGSIMGYQGFFLESFEYFSKFI